MQWVVLFYLQKGKYYKYHHHHHHHLSAWGYLQNVSFYFSCLRIDHDMFLEVERDLIQLALSQKWYWVFSFYWCRIIWAFCQRAGILSLWEKMEEAMLIVKYLNTRWRDSLQETMLSNTHIKPDSFSQLQSMDLHTITYSWLGNAFAKLNFFGHINFFWITMFGNIIWEPHPGY